LCGFKDGGPRPTIDSTHQPSTASPTDSDDLDAVPRGCVENKPNALLSRTRFCVSVFPRPYTNLPFPIVYRPTISIPVKLLSYGEHRIIHTGTGKSRFAPRRGLSAARRTTTRQMIQDTNKTPQGAMHRRWRRFICHRIGSWAPRDFLEAAGQLDRLGLGTVHGPGRDIVLNDAW